MPQKSKLWGYSMTAYVVLVSLEYLTPPQTRAGPLIVATTRLLYWLGPMRCTPYLKIIITPTKTWEDDRVSLLQNPGHIPGQTPELRKDPARDINKLAS